MKKGRGLGGRCGNGVQKEDVVWVTERLDGVTSLRAGSWNAGEPDWTGTGQKFKLETWTWQETLLCHLDLDLDPHWT